MVATFVGPFFLGCIINAVDGFRTESVHGIFVVQKETKYVILRKQRPNHIQKEPILCLIMILSEL